jgi:peroxiredoxin
MSSDKKRDPQSSWPRTVLVLAGIYNVVWGTLIVLFPNALFRLSNIAEPTYPGIWQCVGMIVGVYGVGYLLASRAPHRHWPIVLVGLLGKIFGPIGFIFSAASGQLPWSWAWMILANDVIWWIPFAVILFKAFEFASAPAEAGKMQLRTASTSFVSHRGATLKQLSKSKPLLVIFLRHSGCTFCREMLSDLREQLPEIQRRGFEPVLVHMSDPMRATQLFDSFGLGTTHRFSDPEQQLYRAFGIGRGDFWQLYGRRVWIRGAKALLWDGHGLGYVDGDGFQMPAAFVLYRSQVLGSYFPSHAADRISFPTLMDSATRKASTEVSGKQAAERKQQLVPLR